MLVFATSGKGGTGRSVTSSNVAYQSAIAGNDVCYLDFGSPTAGAVFDVDAGRLGVREGGLHSFLLGRVAEPRRLDVFTGTERTSVRGRPYSAGRLELLPGDSGVGEFPSGPDLVRRCAGLLGRLNSEFGVCFVDLSAGRSYALQMVLAAVRQLHGVQSRWLVYHRWTKQHVLAAAALVHGEHGILDTGAGLGHDREELLASLRFVRTATVDPARPGVTAQQAVWIEKWDSELRSLAQAEGAGPLALLHTVPLDPLLQWHEQLITNDDVQFRGIANAATADAFKKLAELILDDKAWEVR